MRNTNTKLRAITLILINNNNKKKLSIRAKILSSFQIKEG